MKDKAKPAGFVDKKVVREEKEKEKMWFPLFLYGSLGGNGLLKWLIIK